MTIDELIRQLTEFAADGHGEADVRLAIQPAWPFEHRIEGLTIVKTDEDDIADLEKTILSEEFPEDEDDMRTALETMQEKQETILYIREGTQLGYLDKGVWDE